METPKNDQFLVEKKKALHKYCRAAIGAAFNTKSVLNLYLICAKVPIVFFEIYQI